MTAAHMTFPDEVPVEVVKAIYNNVVPELKAWLVAGQFDFARDIDGMSVQRHENRRDWVWKFHMAEGSTKVFLVEMRTLN